MRQRETIVTVNDTQPNTILLLADDAPLRRLLTVQLQLLHFDVTHLASLEDAGRVRVSARTALALLDIQQFSPQAASAIHRLGEFCPVIVITAKDAIEQALHAGAADNLVKPVAPARLSAAIDRAIETRAMRNQFGTMEKFAMYANRSDATPSNHMRSQTFTLSFDEMPTMEQLKDKYIERMLAAHGGNREAAARAMGISARNLYRHIADKRGQPCGGRYSAERQAGIGLTGHGHRAMGTAGNVSGNRTEHQARDAMLVASAGDDVVATIIFRIQNNCRSCFSCLERDFLDPLHVGSTGYSRCTVEDAFYICIIQRENERATRTATPDIDRTDGERNIQFAGQSRSQFNRMLRVGRTVRCAENFLGHRPSPWLITRKNFRLPGVNAH